MGWPTVFQNINHIEGDIQYMLVLIRIVVIRHIFHTYLTTGRKGTHGGDVVVLQGATVNVKEIKISKKGGNTFSDLTA